MAQTAQKDAVRFLHEQHQQVRDLFAAITDGTTDRAESFEALVRMLAVHETAEEMVVYPALKSSGDEGKAVAEARLAEEDEAKKALASLEKVGVDSPDFGAAFAAFRTMVEAHADAEEREVFPLLERITDQAKLDMMGKALMFAEGIAPTHPHKSAPESAIGNMLVGPFVSMVDRVRDAIRDATKG